MTMMAAFAKAQQRDLKPGSAGRPIPLRADKPPKYCPWDYCQIGQLIGTGAVRMCDQCQCYFLLLPIEDPPGWNDQPTSNNAADRTRRA